MRINKRRGKLIQRRGRRAKRELLLFVITQELNEKMSFSPPSGADLYTVRLFDHKLLSAMTCLLHFPHWSGQIKKSTTLPTGLSILLAYI